MSDQASFSANNPDRLDGVQQVVNRNQRPLIYAKKLYIYFVYTIRKVRKIVKYLMLRRHSEDSIAVTNTENYNSLI